MDLVGSISIGIMVIRIGFRVLILALTVSAPFSFPTFGHLALKTDTKMRYRARSSRIRKLRDTPPASPHSHHRRKFVLRFRIKIHIPPYPLEVCDLPPCENHPHHQELFQIDLFITTSCMAGLDQHLTAS